MSGLVLVACLSALLVGLSLGVGAVGATDMTPTATATPGNAGPVTGSLMGLTPIATSSVVIGDEALTPTPSGTPYKGTLPAGGPTPIAVIDLPPAVATPTGTPISPGPVPTGGAGATPPPPARTPFAYPDAIRGAYVAWALPDQAIPPARDAADPLAPGNHVLGLDCLTYLGPGDDPGMVDRTYAVTLAGGL